MPNTAQVLFPLCPLRDLKIVNELVRKAEAFNSCFDVIAQFLAELNVANADYFGALTCIYHIVLHYFLQH